MNYLLMLLTIAVAVPAHSVDWDESQELGDVFDQAGVTGTFVVYDPHADSTTGYNQQRAEQRYLPASTFKIANSLIGLSVGAITSVDDVLSYGGDPQPIQSWERDMGLREAIKISNVPIYQNLARRIGLERMQAGVTELGYGNRQIGSQVDMFWLRGPLKISAVEQAEFLGRLAQWRLPLKQSVQTAVGEILQVDVGDGWYLYAKTGWAVRSPEVDIGWWVGWIERDGKIKSFALNIDMPTRDYITLRISLGRSCLQALGLMPASDSSGEP